MRLVHIVEGGERAQMSKRSGDFVSLDELLDDIGVDAARWFMLWRSHETTVDLDLELARSQSSENPVYYVQYAHARIASILRKAEGGGRRGGGRGGGSRRRGRPSSPAEKALIKRLLEFPRRGARGGRAAGAAPDLRLLDRRRRRLPRLLPRLPGRRRRGRGGRALAPGALPARRSGRSPAASACSGSRRRSGCDGRVGANKLPVLAEIAGLRPGDPAQWGLCERDFEQRCLTELAAPAPVLVTGAGDGRGSAPPGWPAPRPRAAAARRCSSATWRGRGSPPSSASRRRPGLHEYLRWEADAGADPAAAGARRPGLGEGDGAAGLRRRRRARAVDPATLLGVDELPPHGREAARRPTSWSSSSARRWATRRGR